MESRLDRSDPFIVFSSARHHLTRRVHSQQPLDMNDYILTHDSLSTSHQSHARLLDRFLDPRCFDICMLHTARATSRHRAACSVRVCVYSKRAQSTRFLQGTVAVGCRTLPQMHRTSPLRRWRGMRCMSGLSHEILDKVPPGQVRPMPRSPTHERGSATRLSALCQQVHLNHIV